MAKTLNPRLSLPRGFSLLPVAAFALALAACGGGEDRTEAGAVQFAAQVRALGVAQGAPAQTLETQVAVTATMVLDWAEYKFPELFPKALGEHLPAVLYEGVLYNARAYSGPWGVRYLGITLDGRIFGLGDFTGEALQQFDDIAFWSAQVLNDQCAVNPGSCSGTNVPAGPFNNCAMPAAQALATGNRLLATYAMSGSSTGQFTLDALVQGPGTFNGQPAVKVFSKIQVSAVSEGVSGSGSTEVTNYEQDAGGGFVRLIGVESRTVVDAVTVPGFGSQPASVSETRIVFEPGSVNVELSIQPGQSITKTETATSNGSINGTPLPPTTLTTLETHAFVGREPLSVQGKTYNTCRYTVTNPGGASGTTTQWVIDGMGVAVRTETVTTVLGETRTEVTELVNGSFNGTPL